MNLHIVQRTPPGILSKLAGVEVEDWTTLAPKESRTARLESGQDLVLNTFVERLRPTTARPVARWLPGDALLSDAPAITVNPVGKGRVIYIGGFSPVATVETLVAQYMNPVASASADVEIIIRQARGKAYAIALNHSQAPQRVLIPHGNRDLLSGTSIRGEIVLPPFGVAVVRISSAD